MTSKDKVEISKIKAIILDTIGTITSIDFIEGLHQFTYDNVDNFLKDHIDDEAVQRCRNEWIMRTEQSYPDPKWNFPATTWRHPETKVTLREDFARNIRYWLDEAKEKYLWIESLCMECAYGSGVKAHLYEDVVPFLREMVDLEKRIYIYNTYTTEPAQRRHFEKSTEGDVSQLITDYFMYPCYEDEPKSYKELAKTIHCETDEILYITDTVPDGQAAREAGCSVYLIIRSGNKPLDEETKKKFWIIESLQEILNS